MFEYSIFTCTSMHINHVWKMRCSELNTSHWSLQSIISHIQSWQMQSNGHFDSHEHDDHWYHPQRTSQMYPLNSVLSYIFLGSPDEKGSPDGDAGILKARHFMVHVAHTEWIYCIIGCTACIYWNPFACSCILRTYICAYPAPHTRVKKL